jgi:lipopolysaccharide transport system ATP-binding protein
VKPALEFQKISKLFEIHHQGVPYLSFRDRLTGMFRRSGEKEKFWALKDVSFEVPAGSSIGIVGKNGAGKSTLLKILSRITPPTSGRIVRRGRISSLLEVGTGFHQELTGRENIFMNGSILGMKHAEIKARFDEIVDFSGTEKFLDTPLKHYSSGMQLRLAFAVAAHLEPEILVVDEVLAVGDAEFQKKSLKKMEDVSGEGRTLLFVSHNLPSLKAICKTGILLRNGQLVAQGTMEQVINEYTSQGAEGKKIVDGIHYYHRHIKVHNLRIAKSESSPITIETSGIEIEADIEFFKKTNFELDIHLKKDDAPVASFANFVSNDPMTFEPGRYRFIVEMKLPPLRSGKYKLDLYFTDPFVSWFALSENIIEIEIINSNHHIFLNNPSLKWGSILLDGSVRAIKLQ